ncbi:MAG: MMPL family transporter, partial [Myxococcota bacterium]|nr:MMPL family transporter [Myxococcota bacterium]
VQLHLEGELKQPEVLRELGRLSDELSRVPHVTNTSHIGQVVALLNDAMESAKRIPDTPGKVRTLMTLMTGQAGTRKLVTDDRKGALLWLKLDTVDPAELEVALDTIESRVAQHYPGGRRSYTVARADGPRAADVADRTRDLVVHRIQAIAQRHGLGAIDTETLREALGAEGGAGSAEGVAEVVRAYLRSKEALVELPAPADGVDPAALVARAAAALGPGPSEDALLAATARALGKPKDDMTAGDVAFSLESVLEEAWRDAGAAGRVDQLVTKLGFSEALGRAPAATRELAAALMDLASPTAMVAPLAGAGDEETISVGVTGLPVLYRGLSRSVTSNQFKSLGFALGLVLLILMVVFRSVTGGVLATVPTALTLLIIYGAMGAMDVHLDIGTSMLASIIIGTGVDYGVHLLDAWRVGDTEPLADGARHAAEHAGPAIWTNALAVCAGFFVLTLGDARPLQNVGALTAAAMLTAAVVT